MDYMDIVPGLISAVPSFALGIAAYVLMALGLYTLAERRGIEHAWLAWIPVASVWIQGSLSDQFRYVVRGEVRSRRKLLLVLSIVEAVLSIAVMAALVALLLGVATATINGSNEQEMIERAMGPMMQLFALGLPLAAVGITLMIIRYMALYDIYTSCDPSNNVLFLVLSILIGVTQPFFVFFNRNKDLGMPMRRDAMGQIGSAAPAQWDGSDYL